MNATASTFLHRRFDLLSQKPNLTAFHFKLIATNLAIIERRHNQLARTTGLNRGL